jgi:putative membrane protein
MSGQNSWQKMMNVSNESMPSNASAPSSGQVPAGGPVPPQQLQQPMPQQPVSAAAPAPPNGPMPPAGAVPQGASMPQQPMPPQQPRQPMPQQPMPPVGAVPQGASMPAGSMPPSGSVPPNTQPPAGAQTPANSLPDPLVPGPHHVHTAYIWLGGLLAIVTTLLIIFSSGLDSLLELFQANASDLVFVIVGVVLVVVAAVFVWFWLSWRNLTYELTPTELWLFSGIIVKKRRHVPYQRVQAVNQTASLLKRIFGLTNAQIDTAGGATNEEVRIPYLRKTDADQLRSELFRRKRVLLDGGYLEPDGTAVVGGWRYPSLWAHINAGGNPYQPIQPIPLPGTVVANGPVVAGYSNDAGAAQAVAGGVSFAATVPTAVGAASQQAPMAPAAGGAPPHNAAASASAMPPSAAAMPAGMANYNVLDGVDRAIGNFGGILDPSRPDLGYVRYELGLTNKELALAAISGSGAASSVLVLIFCIVFAAIAIPAASGDFFLSMLFGWVIAITAISSVVVLISSFIGDIVRLGGFRARRYETRIEVESGLLGRTSHGLDIDRVQSLLVRQTFVRRLIGYCEVCVSKVNSSSSSGSNSNDASQDARGVIVHPFVKVDRVPQIVAGMLPEYADAPQPAMVLPKVALRRGIVRQSLIRNPVLWAVVILAVAALPFASSWASLFELPVQSLEAGFQGLFTAAAAIVLMSIAYYVVNAVLWYRESRLGYNSRFMTIVHAGYRTVSETFPRRKIQFAWTRTNPFQRMAKVCTINVRTAAGVSGKTMLLWDVDQEAADRWMDWVRPGGSHTPMSGPGVDDASPSAGGAPAVANGAAGVANGAPTTTDTVSAGGTLAGGATMQAPAAAVDPSATTPSPAANAPSADGASAVDGRL